MKLFTIQKLNIIISASQVLSKTPFLLHRRYSDGSGPVSHIVEGEEPLNRDCVLELNIHLAPFTLAPLPHLQVMGVIKILF